MITLFQPHLTEWENSHVSKEIIQRNVWSIDDPAEVDKLLNRNTKRKWKHSHELVPGWAVAGVDPVTGERTYRGAQFKPDTPSVIDGKEFKYLSPSKQTLAPLFLEMEDPEYWPSVKNDVHQEIAICEGAKKAGALLTKGIPAISIPGVTTGQKRGRLRPELASFCQYGRKILLFFDRDIIDKRQVKLALHNLGRLLKAKGCVVEVVEWDNRYKGIDDAIAAGIDVGDRIAKAKTIEEWKEEAEANSDEADGEICTLARRYQMVHKRLKGRLRWNSLKGKIELDGEPVELTHLRLKLAIDYNIQLPTEDCAQICLYIAQQAEFSPVTEYLNECAEAYPADSDLLDQVAETYLGASEPLHKMFIRKTLISAVARALVPGCKVDTVCILQGVQGCGKSTFWKILASEPWFDDTVTNASDKDERLKLHQAWMVEWAELEAIFKRKDISAVKAFITTQTDQVRPPYGRDILEMNRPSIIVGSTNETEFLADPTGNRRYWVVPVSIPDIPLHQLAEERDRIWAAAVHAFKSGEGWTLPPEMRMVASADASNYSFSDPWEERIFDYCSDLRQVTTTELLANAIQLDIAQMDKRAEMRVTSLLRSSGWGSSRGVVQGRRVRIWKNPKFFHVDCPGCPERDESLVERLGQPTGQPPGQPTGQPPENGHHSPVAESGLNGGGQPDNPDAQIPKSSRTQEGHLSKSENQLNGFYDGPFGVGDLVEVLSGALMYKKATVKSWTAGRKGQPGKVRLTHPDWVVDPEFTTDQVQLIQRARGNEEKQAKH